MVCCGSFWRCECGCLVMSGVMGVLFVMFDVNFVCLLSQVRGVRIRVQNKTRSAAGIHLISDSLPIPLNTYLLTVMVAFLTFSLVIAMRFFPLIFCGVIRREDVRKMVLVALWRFVSSMLLDTVKKICWSQVSLLLSAEGV